MSKRDITKTVIVIMFTREFCQISELTSKYYIKEFIYVHIKSQHNQVINSSKILVQLCH